MVVVVRIGRLGDFLVALPAMAVLRQRHADERILLITAVSGSASVRAMAGCYSTASTPPWVMWAYPSFVDRVITVQNWSSYSEWRAIRNEIRREEEITATYVLSFYGEGIRSRLKKALWLRSLGVRGKIYSRFSGSARSKLSFQMQTPLDIAGKSCRPWGPDIELSDLPTIKPGQVANDAASRMLAVSEGGKGPRIVLYTSSTHEHKRWPARRFAEVVNGLSQNYEARFVLVGSSAEADVSNQIKAYINGCEMLDLSGKTTLVELAAVLSQCDLFLGNDGGIAHLAAAVGIPCVTIMSGVHPAGVWDPSSKGSVAVRVDGLECIGCGSEFSCPRGHQKCIADISPYTVLKSCEEVLGKGIKAKSA